MKINIREEERESETEGRHEGGRARRGKDRQDIEIETDSDEYLDST